MFNREVGMKELQIVIDTFNYVISEDDTFSDYGMTDTHARLERIQKLMQNPDERYEEE